MAGLGVLIENLPLYLGAGLSLVCLVGVVRKIIYRKHYTYGFYAGKIDHTYITHYYDEDGYFDHDESHTVTERFYSYIVDGRTYKANTIVDTKSMLRIFYDPEDPKSFRLDSENSYLIAELIVSSVILGLALDLGNNQTWCHALLGMNAVMIILSIIARTPKDDNSQKYYVINKAAGTLEESSARPVCKDGSSDNVGDTSSSVDYGYSPYYERSSSTSVHPKPAVTENVRKETMSQESPEEMRKRIRETYYKGISDEVLATFTDEQIYGPFMKK